MPKAWEEVAGCGAERSDATRPVSAIRSPPILPLFAAARRAATNVVSA